MAGARLAGAATLIAALTVASRIAGFGRILVFTWAVGIGALATTYQTANYIPNIIFEIVAGGALASLVVPVVAAPLADGDRHRVGAVASALLTWVFTLLLPVALLVALAAGPVIEVLGDKLPADQRRLAVDMLRIFAPQLPLYGIGIVLSGLLQAHRRFVWPVLAPLLSSVAVSAAYLAFVAHAGRNPAVTAVDRTGLLLLAGGTTAAVAVLTLSLVVPARRLGLSLRPSYRLGGVAGPVRRLAVAGAVTVGAQYACLALVIWLAGGGPEGAFAVFLLAQTVFLLPWAVLAVPIATSAFPALAGSRAAGDTGRFDTTAATSLRATLLVSAFGAAALLAVAPDAAAVLAGLDRDDPDPAPIAAGIAAFAPGLLGYGLFALLSRVLYAAQAPKSAAVATAVGWAAVAVSSLALAWTLPTADRVAALAAGNSIGMVVLGVALLVAVRHRLGARPLAGAGRAAAVAVVAGGAATAVGIVARTITMPGEPGTAAALVRATLSAVLVVTVFGALAYAADRRDTRPALTALVRRVRGRAHRSAGRPAEPAASIREE